MTPVIASKISRLRGWLLAILGSCLALGMAVLALFFLSVIGNTASGGTHWNGSPAMTTKVFELFGTIFLFGVAAIVAGVFQLRNGRANWPAVMVMLVLVVVMYFLGQSIMQAG